MSSKFIPPNVGSKVLTAAINSATELDFTSISKTSMPAKFLNKIPLPSITGLEASGPMLPRPRTAVPSEMTATKLPLDV